ncbi:RHS domain-containing protein [Streptomyces profundus]|uniref:RHS domain-containing protein n=1 Tax=Streptomyces profundus TaxID=2867410 RepID=UPI003CC866D0|nr:RHS domain-containing protein [Streptomyces sp. MA3_2.13]
MSGGRVGHVLSQAERRVDSLSGAEVDSRFFAVVTDHVGAPAELVDGNGDIAWRARATGSRGGEVGIGSGGRLPTVTGCSTPSARVEGGPT